MSEDESNVAKDNSTANIAEFMRMVSQITSPLAVVRQHAVGHGGFHTGALGVRYPQIRWVYDCGSWRKVGKAALKVKIASYANTVGKSDLVNLLFLSHFDADHVSGIRQFLNKLRVETAIVPYLETEEIFGVIAEAAATHRSKSDVRDLCQALFSPGDWFGRQGVHRVVRLHSGIGRDGSGTRAGPPLGPVADRPFPQVALLGSDGKEISFDSSSGQVIDASPGLRGEVTHGPGIGTDWSFLPFVNPVSPVALECLRNAASHLVGIDVADPKFGARLIELIQGKGGLKKLRDIYVDRELADANGKSLSLYVGPLLGALRVHLAPRSYHTNGSGWLLTGDAKLRNNSKFVAWRNKYKNINSYLISHLMLPHHGAAADYFNRGILDIAPAAQLFITADASDTLRPHEDVTAEMTSAGDTRHIQRVTEIISDELWQVSGCSDYRCDAIVDKCLSWT